MRPLVHREVLSSCAGVSKPVDVVIVASVRAGVSVFETVEKVEFDANTGRQDLRSQPSYTGRFLDSGILRDNAFYVTQHHAKRKRVT